MTECVFLRCLEKAENSSPSRDLRNTLGYLFDTAKRKITEWKLGFYKTKSGEIIVYLKR